MSVKQKATSSNLDRGAVEQYTTMTTSFLDKVKTDFQEIAQANRLLIEGTAPFVTTNSADARFYSVVFYEHLTVDLGFGSPGELFKFDGDLWGLSVLGAGFVVGAATFSVPLDQLNGLQTDVQVTTGVSTQITWLERKKIIGVFYGTGFGSPGVVYGNGTFKKQ